MLKALKVIVRGNCLRIINVSRKFIRNTKKYLKIINDSALGKKNVGYEEIKNYVYILSQFHFSKCA